MFYGCIIASVLFILAILFAPLTLRARKKPYHTQSVSNAKQIGLALLEFDTDYGAYPSAATIPLVSKSHPAHGYHLTGKSSNAHFRQFLAVGLTQSEEIFYAKTRDSRKPDNNISRGEALKKHEVGFSYITGLSSIGNPARPIVLTPLIPGTTKFDPKPLEGFAVVLRSDYSARSYKIGKDGHIYDDKGIDLLSPKNPIWDGKAPVIHYPE